MRKSTIPKSSTTIHCGDRLLVICSAADAPRFTAVIGPQIEMDWEAVPAPVFSRRIVITKSEYNGVALGSLRLHNGYRLNATRVNRAGVDLLASPALRLQMGDRLTVVGKLEDIDRLADKLGNSMKRLNQPNLITIFVGIILGIILGSINVGFGMKLGLAGGPLVVAILLSRFGYEGKTGNLHFDISVAVAARTRHLHVPRIGRYRCRQGLCRSRVQHHRYVVGHLGIRHNSCAASDHRPYRARGQATASIISP